MIIEQVLAHEVCERCDTAFRLLRKDKGTVWVVAVVSSEENFGSESAQVFTNYPDAHDCWRAAADCGCVEVED